MNRITPDDVRSLLLGFLTQKLRAEGRDGTLELSDDCDLLLSGVVDSLGLLEMVTAIQEHYGREIDFEALDPELMTVVGPLCKFVAGKLAEV